MNGTRRAWQARDGEDPLLWLWDVARDTQGLISSGLHDWVLSAPDIVLEGQRRIFLDTDGQVHELARSSGTILAGGAVLETWEDDEVMSPMERSKMLRQLQETEPCSARGQ